jgi:hypothetical protein
MQATICSCLQKIYQQARIVTTTRPEIAGFILERIRSILKHLRG